MKFTHLATALALGMSGTAQANIDIQFDFDFDTSGFFSSNPDSVDVLNAAAALFETRFADSLTAIDSSGSNRFSTLFFNPSDPSGADITLNNQDIAADVILIYVGAADLGGSLGLGGPGVYGCSGSASFCDNAESRGQGDVTGADADDFAPWGGAISFDTETDWHFGLTTTGLGFNEYDFYSVAVHEIAHVLGFGISASFDRLAAGGLFSGSNAVNAYGDNVPLTPDESHWAEGTLSFADGLSQEAAMDPDIFNGVRKNLTTLDYAALQDIGWEVTPVPEADTWAMLLAGLGLVGFAARRRMA
jgi:hypothetical protein